MPTAITGPARPSAVLSPLVELGSALHVLHDPGHHGAAGWAAAVRAAMSHRLADWTDSWSWTVRAIRATPFVTVPGVDRDVPAAVARLRAVPPARLAGQLLRPVSPRRGTRTAAHWAASRGPAVAAGVAALLDRPAAAVDDFLAFLELSWREWFADEWRRVRPELAARARRFTDTVGRHGAPAALATLDPSVTATATGVTIAKLRNARHDVSRRGLLVTPSAFIRPHLYVADVPGHPLLVIHPADHHPADHHPAAVHDGRHGGAPDAPAGAAPGVGELLRRLDVVANRARLEVARAIATEPRTAGEIAALWNVDATMVNRHLRALAAAGLAVPVRTGRFVQYRLAEEAVAALGTDLLALLLR